MTVKRKIFILICFMLASLTMLGQAKQSFAHDLTDGWKPLFDGKTLSGWKIVRYGGEGKPRVRKGALILPKAKKDGLMTGVCWIGDALPAINYEIYYEARRTEGSDIFAALTFPHAESYITLIFGGWRGVINGLSCIDGYDASENETTQRFSLKNNEWHPVYLRVTTDSIRATVGKEHIVNISTAGKEFSLRHELLNTGLTFWTYLSTGEIRNIRFRNIEIKE